MLSRYHEFCSTMNPKGDVCHEHSFPSHSAGHSGLHQRGDARARLSAHIREEALEDNDYHAVEQNNFPPDYQELKEKGL